MSVNNDLKVSKAQAQLGMAAVNAASLPFRSLHVVVGGLVQLAASSHPAAKEAIGKVGLMIHESWQNSAPGKKWETTRASIISDLQQINITKAEASCFLDSIEELVVVGGTLGIGALAKSAYKTARHFSAQIRGRNSGLPVIEDIYFTPNKPNETVFTHLFAANTPAEGYIIYRYARGTQNSVLVYLEYVQKGWFFNPGIKSSTIKGHTPYSSSHEALNAIKEIGESLGGNRVFLQFHPENPKFRSFVERHSSYKGDHPVRDSGFWPVKEKMLDSGMFFPLKGKLNLIGDNSSFPVHIHPVFELTAPCAGTTQKIVKLMTPFGVSETLRVLSSESYIEPAHLSYSLTSPVRAYRGSPDVTFHVQAAPQASDTGPEMPLSDTDEIISSLGDHILEFAGEVSGVKPALDQLKRLNEIMQCLAKNPQEAPIKVVSELLRQPTGHIGNILNNPKAIIQNAEHFLQDPAANYMGGLAAVGSLMTFMNSVTWACEFMRKPGRSARELVKSPYTCVKGAIHVGISLIRHPEKTTKQLFKSFVKMPEGTVKGFLRAVGLKKRKKHKAVQPQPTPTIDPKVMEQLAAKYITDLTALYCLARVKGFIDPYKTVEDYHHDLLEDFQQGCPTLPNGHFDFPQFLVEKMQANSLVYLRSFSPRAHPDAPIISPEVLLASQAIDETLQKLDTTFRVLEVVDQKHEEVAQQLSVEQEKLSQASESLGNTLAQNREKIKQALLNKKNKN